MKTLRVLLSSIGLFFCLHAHAQEVIEVSRREKLVTDDVSGAKNLLMEQATQNISIENIRAIIGEEKTERSKEIIKNKVIKNSNKYILSIKTGSFTRTKGTEFTMDVDMKVSLKGLRALLLDYGLLYQLEGPPKVLPAIYFIDRLGGRSYGWWSQNITKEHAFLISQAGAINTSLKDQLHKIGFYAMTPISSRFGQSVPETFRGENLQRADYLFLGEYFKSSVVVRGNVVFRGKPNVENVYLIDVRLEALQSSNGRLMAEVVRTYETEPHSQYKDVLAKKFDEVSSKISEDLAAQMAEAWKKGTFGASVVKLAVVGKITPAVLEDFKKNVVLQIRDIKGLRERWIEARKTTFEVDSSVLPQQLAISFRAAKFAQFKVEVEDVSTESLTIRLVTN